MKKSYLIIATLLISLTLGVVATVSAQTESVSSIYGYIYDGSTMKAMTRQDISKYNIKIKACYNSKAGQGCNYALFDTKGKYKVNVPFSGIQTVELSATSPFFQDQKMNLKVVSERSRSIIFYK